MGEGKPSHLKISPLYSLNKLCLKANDEELSYDELIQNDSKICSTSVDCIVDSHLPCSKLSKPAFIVNSKPLSANSFLAKTKYMGIRVGKGRKFVRMDTRDKHRIRACQEIGSGPSGRMVSCQSSLLSANSVTFVKFKLGSDSRANSVFLRSVNPLDGESEEVVVTEGVYKVLAGRVVLAAIGNGGDSHHVLPRGFQLDYLPLKERDITVPKSDIIKRDINTMADDPTKKGKSKEDADKEESEIDDDELKKRFNDVWTQLGLEENALLKEHPQVQRKAKKLIRDYLDIFSDSEPGETDLVELTLKLKPGTQPIRQKYRDLNPAMEASLQEQIDTWLKQDIIEESESSWASPLVPVRKKDGTIRWAVDFRRVNEHLELDSYPLPRIQGLLDKAGGHRVYSTLDAVQAYFHIKMAKESRHITAFATPNGLWQFKRMPFGLCTAVAAYSRFIAAALNRLGTKDLQAYLDDVLVYSQELNSHVDRLREVFEAHRAAGIKLKPKKTRLFQESCEYLGHQLSASGIGMVDNYIQRILDWPAPKTVKEMNSMLGFFSYYRSFIPAFSEYTYEMNAEKKKKKLEWTETMAKNLEKLKEAFKTASIRSVPKFDLPEIFQLTTDYSGKAISAILSQVQDGKERLIAACGRKTTDAESRYASWKGEMSAVVYGIRKFSSILSFRKFQINTDSSCMTYLKTLKKNTGMIGRWLEELSGYDFQVVHRPGKLNTNADSLSRRTDDQMPDPSPEEVAEQEEFIGNVTSEDVIGEDATEEVTTEELDRANIFKHQVVDPILKEVRVWISQGRLPDKLELRGKHRDCQLYAQIYESLTMAEDGLIEQKIDTFMGKRHRVLIPEKLRGAVFKMTHQHRSAGHFGITATIARTTKQFWYPGLATDVRLRVGVCHDCLAKVTKEKLKAGVHVPQINGYPGQTLFIDLVGPLPETGKGNKYIMSAQDGFSRFIRLYPLPNKETKTVVDCLVDKHIATFGCPMRIHSDNGKEFVSNLFAGMTEKLDIKHTRTPSYNPQSNPVERYHRTLNATMRTLLDREDKQWDTKLSALMLTYNTKVNETTGVTPFLAFLGREAKMPIDLVLPSPDPEYSDTSSGVTDMMNRYHRIYSFVAKRQAAVIKRNSQQYLGTAKFQAGDIVWYLSARGEPGKPKKITNAWTGPWVVVEKRAEVLYLIEPLDGASKHKAMTVHCGRLRKFRGDPIRTRIPRDLVLDDEDEEGEELTLGGPTVPPQLGVPVYTPQHFPEILDKEEVPTAPRQPDPLEEVDLGQPQYLHDTVPADSPVSMEQGADSVPGPSQAVPSPSHAGARERGRGEEPSVARRNSVKRRGGELEARGEDGESKRKSGVFTRWKEQYTAYQEAAETDPSTVTLPDSDTDMPDLCSMCVPIKRGARIPYRATQGSAGVDLYLPADSIIAAGTVTAVPLGLSVQLPDRHYLQLHGRSSLEKRGILLVGGIVDSDFRGEIHCLLYNTTQQELKLCKGQRVCQAILLKYEVCEFQPVDKLDNALSGRGDSGFGSTGTGLQDPIHGLS